MKENDEKEFQPTTTQKVKQMKGWENLDDELAQRIADTVVKFAELFYITIARDMSLNPIPQNELTIEEEKPKKGMKNQNIKR